MEKVILIVDDSATVRKFVTTALRLKGYKVIGAVDGMDALEKLPYSEIDLIITDLNMPDMDGYEFIKTLRESPTYKDLPIIILSSVTDQQNKKLGIQLGASVYLEKPFRSDQIQDAVEKFINKTTTFNS